MRQVSVRISLSFFWIGILRITTPIVHADGKHFPEKAYKASPAIPLQRAILVFKDNTETLVIESALDGQGQQFGWIIPLPAKPTKFEQASSGLLETLSLNLQPNIIHDLSELVKASLVFAVLVTLLYLGAIYLKGHVSSAVIVILVILFFAGLFVSSSQLAKNVVGTPQLEISGVAVSDAQIVGNYELLILEATESNALDQWLGNNRFKGLSGEDKKIVDDYIADKWCFVAAKLTRGSEGFTRPHPLAMTFPTEQAIYPIRLTGTIGSNLYLELFVIADQQAYAKGLNPELVDTYKYSSQLKVIESLIDEDTVASGFSGGTYQVRIGHPDANQYLWSGCTISKLFAELKSEDMKDDFIFSFKRTRPYQKRYFSQQGEFHSALIFSFHVWWLSLVISSIIIAKRKNQVSSRLPVGQIFLLSLLLTASTYGIMRLSVSGFKVQSESGSTWLWDHKYNYMATQRLGCLAKEFDSFTGFSEEQAEDQIDHFFQCAGQKNIFTGNRMKLGDAPGEISIRKENESLILSCYSREGIPIGLRLSDESTQDLFKSLKEPDEVFQEIWRNDGEVDDDALDWISHRGHGLVEMWSILSRLYQTQPKDKFDSIFCNLQKHLNQLPSQLSEDRLKRMVEFEMGMLGCLCHIVPPTNLEDIGAVEVFLKKAQAWYTNADGNSKI
ncbi:MAG: DUF2330 domain-containing protein [Sedimentisphaerales bacterium]|nr:DUF2330 domain-containing protein [Sedimentisphaerales bacterium]